MPHNFITILRVPNYKFTNIHQNRPFLGNHKINAKTFKRFEILQCFLGDQNRIKLEMNNRNISTKSVNI